MNECELLIGTSGYDYVEWKGVLYPNDMKKDDFLSFYATQFQAVELNFSFYKQPTPAVLTRMVERTDKKVRFSIKGNRTFTHEVDAGKWKDEVKTFRDALHPLTTIPCMPEIVMLPMIRIDETFLVYKMLAHI
jgi:uncharacterized protein YecE (DUF72 family)